MKNYTYDSANRLVEIGDQLSVTSLSYNGLGQRLSMDAAGVIATYVLDGDRPLTAESNGDTTFYLYGLGALGEKTTEWNFSLPDGTNTPRQLSDLSGDITFSARYTPWGDTLDTFGTGGFTFGYLGSVLDATTGLLYVGNGQYYDPSTGRFLTRDIYPNSPNPYVPWNPLGAILGPLAVVSLFYTRRKKGSKAGTFLVLLIVLGSVGLTLAACGPQPQPNPAPPVPPNGTPIPGSGTDTGGGVSTPEPSSTPLAVPCPEPKNWLPELFQITHYVVVLENDPYFASSYEANIPFWENGQNKYYPYNYAFIVGNSPSGTCDVNCVSWSVYVQGTGKAKDGKYITTDLDPSHFPPEFPSNAVYQYVNQPQPKCGTYLREDETIAVSINILNSPGFECGAQYYIEGHGDKIYTITDSGTLKSAKQFDIYAGEQTHDAFYAKYPDTGASRRVAKVRQ